MIRPPRTLHVVEPARTSEARRLQARLDEAHEQIRHLVARNMARWPAWLHALWGAVLGGFGTVVALWASGRLM